ncbi:TonB-dependent receptor [Mucilaginibacter sp.]|uniref:TonB-dependent receptor domain-containing protein n=1 Tax=Mucilaginibacter sp. TaxID=1882438 RepID=UPI00326378BB
MKSIITSFLILFCFLFATAQQATVSGKVQDQASKTALPYVTIAIKNSASKIVAAGITNEHGAFSLDGIPAGDLNLTVSFMGYKTLTQSLAVPLGKASLDLGVLKLQADATQLQEVKISGERPGVSLKLDKKVFEVGKDVLSQNGSANDVLNGVPSVAVSPTGTVSLRGNSSVLVLINGRRSGLTQSNALDQIAADQIERVEVITNPSSRYDASGSAGIINIILKKNKKSGFNGQVRLVGGSPNDSRINPSINYKSDKINLFSTFGIRSSDYVGLYTTNQSAINNGKTALLNQVQNENRHDDGKLLYIGADYFINEHQTVTAAFLKNATHDHDKTHLLYKYSNPTGSQDSTLKRDGESWEKRDYNQLEFNYTQTFKQPTKKWTVAMQYDWWNSDKNWNLFTERLTPAALMYPGIRTSSIGGSKDLLVQTDFVQPLDTVSTLEFGIKAENRKVLSDFLAEQQQGNDWAIFQGIDNHLKYNETITSAYAQFSSKAGRLAYMIGLRTELTRIAITDVKNTYNDRKDYDRLFPTFNLSYRFNTAATMQLNYSKRINRPSLYALYPFNELTDLNAQYIGNPGLNPSYSDVFELGFLKIWDRLTFNPSVYYQAESGYIQDFTYRQNAVFFSIPINIDREIRSGAELSALYNPFKWLQVNGELNFYRFSQKGVYQQRDLGYSGQTLTGRLSSQVKLLSKFSFQSRYNFRSAQSNAQARNAALQSLDMGLSKVLLKDKATLVFDVTNAFNLRKNRSTVTGSDYVLNQTNITNAARYRLSFVYRFNLKDAGAIRQAKAANRN